MIHDLKLGIKLDCPEKMKISDLLKEIKKVYPDSKYYKATRQIKINDLYYIWIKFNREGKIEQTSWSPASEEGQILYKTVKALAIAETIFE